jgi:hypothetical protein
MIRDERDPGYLAWVITAKRSDGAVPNLEKSMAHQCGEPWGADTVSVWLGEVDARRFFDRQPAIFRHGSEVRPVIIYFAVGDGQEDLPSNPVVTQ